MPLLLPLILFVSTSSNIQWLSIYPRTTPLLGSAASHGAFGVSQLTDALDVGSAPTSQATAATAAVTPATVSLRVRAGAGSIAVI